MEHDGPGIITRLGTYRVEGERKVPVGKGGNPQPAPEAVGGGVHGGSFAGNGDAGLLPKADQVPCHPGKPDGRSHCRKNTIIPDPFQYSHPVPGTQHGNKVHKEYGPKGNGENCAV